MSDTFSSLMARTSDAIVSVPTVADLPTDAIEGAIRYVADVDALYTFDGAAWNTSGGVQPPSPATTTDNAIARWDGTVGASLNNSGVIIDDSDNITGVTDLDAATVTLPGGDVQDQLDDKIDLTEKGAALGVATLDGGGKIPVGQLPSAVLTYEGTWNANTNTPTLANGTGDNGMVYLTDTAGTTNFGAGPITFAIGDWAVYNGTIWQKSLNSNAVVSVNSLTGVVTIDAANLDGSTITTAELNYLSGVTSDIQTQLDDKLNSPGGVSDSEIVVFSGAGGVDTAARPVTIDGSGNVETSALVTASGFTGTGFTGNLAVVTGSGGELTESTATDTEVGYLTGVTSSIQDQLDNKMDVGGSHTTLTDIGTNTHPDIDTHIASTSNPHSVTATQVGLGNVDNTSNATERAAVATLANKTLTAPVINNGSISGTSIDGAVIGSTTRATASFTSIDCNSSISGQSVQADGNGGAGYVEVAEQATPPSTPAANFSRVYPKSDAKWYTKDDAGTEQQIASAAATDNRVIRGDGTNLVSGQIDDPGFFTVDAAAGASAIGIVTTDAQTIAGDKTFTGDIRAEGGIYTGSFTLDDDTIATLTPPGAGRGFLHIWGSSGGATSSAQYAVIAFRVNSYVASVNIASNVTVLALNGALTDGAGNGTDGNLNISVQTSTIVVKNRRGSNSGWGYLWMSF